MSMHNNPVTRHIDTATEFVKDNDCVVQSWPSHQFGLIACLFNLCQLIGDELKVSNTLGLGLS